MKQYSFVSEGGELFFQGADKIPQNAKPLRMPESLEREMKSGKQILDFGKKIGGARKDEWRAAGGLTKDDLARMTEEEKAAFVTKGEVWPKPNYRKMKESGYPMEYLFWLKQVYGALAKTPLQRDLDVRGAAAFQDYVELVSAVKNGAMDMSIALTDQANLLQRVGITEDHFGLDIPQPRYINLVTAALRCAVGSACNPDMLAYEAGKAQFLFSKEEKLKERYRVVQLPSEKETETESEDGRIRESVEYTPEGAIRIRKTKLPDVHRVHEVSASWYYYPAAGVLITSGWQIIDTKTRRVAASGFASAAEAEEYLLSGNAKSAVPAKRKQRFKLPVLSGIIREGGRDIRGSSHACGKDLLSRFGFYGGEFGNYLSDEERQKNLDFALDAFTDLCDALDIPEEMVSFGGQLSIAFGARGRGGSAVAHYEPLYKVINLTKMRGAGSLGHEWIHAMDHLAFGGRRMVSEDAYNRNCPEIMRQLVQTLKFDKDWNRTAFYRNATLLDGAYTRTPNGYWKSNCELVARAGAAYIKDKLADKGIRNDYLCGHADIANSGIPISPQGEERVLVNKKFDELFDFLREKY